MTLLHLDKRFADTLDSGENNDEPEQGTEQGFIDPWQGKKGYQHRNENMDEYTA